MGKPVTARVKPGVRKALGDVVEEHKDCRRAWAALERWSIEGLSPEERDARRGQWRTFLAGLRRSGLILDTVDRVAEVGVLAELARRGWDHAWPRVPEAGKLKGRWPGSARGEMFPESVPFVLPEALARRVHAACWHTSAPAIKALRAWNTEAAIVRRQKEKIDEVVEYQRLLGGITTVGDIGRAGLDVGIEQAQAALPHAWALVAAEQFHEREDHLRVPRSHTEDVLYPHARGRVQHVPLSTRVKAWRADYHAQTLDSRVQAHLDRIGLDWWAGRSKIPTPVSLP